MEDSRLQYEKELITPFQPEKIPEERIRELKDRLVELRKENEMRKIEKDKEASARMDVKAIRDKFI